MRSSARMPRLPRIAQIRFCRIGAPRLGPMPGGLFRPALPSKIATVLPASPLFPVPPSCRPRPAPARHCRLAEVINPAPVALRWAGGAARLVWSPNRRSLRVVKTARISRALDWLGAVLAGALATEKRADVAPGGLETPRNQHEPTGIAHAAARWPRPNQRSRSSDRAATRYGRRTARTIDSTGLHSGRRIRPAAKPDRRACRSFQTSSPGWKRRRHVNGPAGAENWC
jgi:hypothetical protein